MGYNNASMDRYQAARYQAKQRPYVMRLSVCEVADSEDPNLVDFFREHVGLVHMTAQLARKVSCLPKKIDKSKDNTAKC